MIVGIGCDITKISRFANKSSEFINKILSPEEKVLYYQKNNQQKSAFLAGRFAAKEAIIKALPTNINITMPEINIFYQNEKPTCQIFTEYKILISISHEKEYAIGYACIQKN